jgi:hypothetical protein
VHASAFSIFPTTDSLYQAVILYTWNIAQKLLIAQITLSVSKNVI